MSVAILRRRVYALISEDLAPSSVMWAGQRDGPKYSSCDLFFIDRHLSEGKVRPKRHKVMKAGMEK